MRVFAFALSTTALFALPALAEGPRSLDAHVHGSGSLNIAIEGGTIAMELEAPGADIVGFEYTAKSAEDRAAVDTAISDLARPLDLFLIPAAAGCKVVEASVSLIGEEDHGDHDHGHGDDHAEAEHDDHDHGDDHAETEHDDHDHDHDHAAAEHDDDDHGHDAAEAAQHTEFHAEYTLDCASPEGIDSIEFAYFERFPNALELDVQFVSSDGAQAFEVERDAPVLDMRELF